MDVNKIIILGNVSQDPEQRAITGGSKVTKVNVATSNVWKDTKTGDKKEKVNFHTVIGWNKLGDTMHKYLKKGDRVYFEGRVDNRSYEDKEGKTRYVTDVVAKELVLLGGSKKAAAAATEQPVEEPSTEDSPF